MNLQLFPDLRPEEYAALKADIAERGMLIPVEVDQDGQVLDGHHRLRIAGELSVEAPTVQRHMADDDERVSHIIALNLRRRHLDDVSWGDMFKKYKQARSAGKRGRPKKGEKGDNLSSLLVELGEIANPEDPKEVAAAKRTAQRRVEAANLPEPLRKAIQQGKKTVSTAKREAKRTTRAAKKPDPLPAGTFRTIVVDPPWDYGDHAVRGAAATHYDVMSLEKIAQLPVGDMAGDEAHLYVWVTNPQLPFLWPIIEAWGFDYKTLITWAKPQMGTGFYFRGATEHIAFCTRGNLPLNAQNITNWFEADRRTHSEKPEEFYNLVERASNRPFVELFARKARDGWSTWGNEL